MSRVSTPCRLPAGPSLPGGPSAVRLGRVGRVGRVGSLLPRAEWAEDKPPVRRRAALQRDAVAGDAPEREVHRRGLTEVDLSERGWPRGQRWQTFGNALAIASVSINQSINQSRWQTFGNALAIASVASCAW